MKYIIKIICLVIISVSISGCILKRDNFEGIDIFTTIYTVEFVTNEIYGEFSNIKSIYPDGVDIAEYEITHKRLTDISKSNLFIYNGLNLNERQTARDLINMNRKVNIIDVSQGLEIKHEEAELWISPSNTLMIAQNIKNNLKNLVTNTSILESIESNFDELKILLSGFDAEFNLISSNATNRTIVVANRAFNFLAKYNFDIINVAADDEEVSSTAMARARRAFSNNENTYLFILEGSEECDNIKALVTTGAKIVYINPMINLTDAQRANGDNYITFMNQFIEAIKTEVY